MTEKSSQFGGCGEQDRLVTNYQLRLGELMDAKLDCCPNQKSAEAVLGMITRACFQNVREGGEYVAGSIKLLVGDYIRGNQGGKSISAENVIVAAGLKLPDTPGRNTDPKPARGKSRRLGSGELRLHTSRQRRRP